MKTEDRQQLIDAILGGIRSKVEFPGIPVHLWITGAEGKPGERDFERWISICTQYADAYKQEMGKRDTDSIFAKFARMYGRKEYRNN